MDKYTVFMYKNSTGIHKSYGVIMYNAVEVAWKMLKIANEEEIRLSNLQLQKLVYIAHGYFLAWKNKPLISDSISAWKFGPVIDSVYHTFKDYRDQKIPSQNLNDLVTDLDMDDDAITAIKGVLKLYGNRSAMELVNLTHQPNTPWDEVWNNEDGKSKLSAEISDKLIKNHFRKVVADPGKVHGL